MLTILTDTQSGRLGTLATTTSVPGTLFQVGFADAQTDGLCTTSAVAISPANLPRLTLTRAFLLFLTTLDAHATTEPIKLLLHQSKNVKLVQQDCT